MIEHLLLQQTKSQFLESHFLRLPYSEPRGCRDLLKQSGWDVIEQLLAAPEADVMVVKEGRRWAENRTPSFPEAKGLYADGYTLLVRHAERHEAELSNIAKSFARDFRAPVDVHLYATPGKSFGFGWHYDVEDVFILQLQGTKEYSLRKNTVNPWPVLDSMPADLRYEREIMPMLKCELAAGDWLYIPNGYWHKADAKSDSISLAVGVMSTTALDALDFARQRLLNSIRWRQRLRVFGEDPEPNGELQEMMNELAEDLKILFQDPAFTRQFLSSRKPEEESDLQ